MTTIKSIGFIGIGNMGNPMAGHLVKAGFDVTVYDARPETVEIFTGQHGGRGARSLREAVAGADAVITMLPDDKVVREVILGEGHGGAAAWLAPGAIVIDMGTSAPIATRALGDALKARAVAVVDAPVMGGVVFAKDASLDIMVAGDPGAVERSLPLLRVMGRDIIRCGRAGNAHALKALANYVNACALVNAIEAMTIGKRFGLDPRMMADALTAMCAGRNHPVRKKIVPHVLTRAFGTGMAMGFIAKDVRIALDTAESIGAFAPLAERVAELWSTAAAQLGPQLDQTEIARYWEESTGVRL
ncbi:MAG: NAD(P)-dependent oxidoreductase [Burkholderiales bacterium]|nr:NAD(P)-dependent oxidoreductase [Burkholderiales bacterium]